MVESAAPSRSKDKPTGWRIPGFDFRPPEVDHFLLAPPADSTAPAESECLLIMAPGFVPPESMLTLAKEVQAASPDIRLWVGLYKFDFPKLFLRYIGSLATGADPSEVLALMEKDGVWDAFLRQMCEQAVAEGFKAQMDAVEPERYHNVFLLGQSAGGSLFAATGFKSVGGMVMLAATVCERYMKRAMVSLEAWPRPVLYLAGELDGQMRWVWHAPYAAELASLALKFGSRDTVRDKPLIILERVNHANTSGSPANVQRGDIVNAVRPLDESVAMAAAHISAFMRAHFAVEPEKKQKAEDELHAAVAGTMTRISPYTRALGLGDVGAPFTQPAAAASAGLLPTGAMRSANAWESTAVHPGLIQEAEAHVARMQQQVLAALPKDARARVSVVTTVHTRSETFAVAMPTMRPAGEAGRFLLHLHVYLNFRNLEPKAPLPFQRPVAPEYCVKLKTAEFVALGLGLPNPSQYSTPLPAELNKAAFDAAMAAVPADVAERYRTHSKLMEFEQDWVFNPSESSADSVDDAAAPLTPIQLHEALVADARITYRYPKSAGNATNLAAAYDVTAMVSAFVAAKTAELFKDKSKEEEETGPQIVRVGAPYVMDALPVGASALPADGGRTMGTYVTKVLSVGHAMEWIWLDSLRTIPTSW